MATYAFGGGAGAVKAVGQKTKVRFVETWAEDDTWTLRFESTLTGPFTLGKGNIAGINPTCGFKLRNRMYIGADDIFCLSSIDDPTLWEEQDAGSAVISFISQYGPQDRVVGFASMQGRLAVIGARSIQLWQPDADPANMALLQTLDNVGSLAMLSIKSIGDLDVMYLDRSGIRSLRANENTLNAFINDVGTAIDLLIRETLIGIDASAACAIVEPTTRQYWLYLNGNIYVLANYPESKIVAWSIYKPTTEVAVTPSAGVYTTVVGGVYYWTKHASGTSLTCGTTVLTASGGFVATATTATEVGTTGTLVRVDTGFTPEKFVVYNNQIYLRSTTGKIYQYGGSNGNTFDHSRAIVEMPWLDLKSPTIRKQGKGIGAAMSGAWTVQASMDPRQTSYTEVINRGSVSSPSTVADSTHDVGHFPYNANGTHIKLKAISSPSAATAAKLERIVFQYTQANVT
jgi:hypothetical protein